ncbi:MAG: hypothetical protein AAB262_07125, partial [Elusimicrobiota bacterium]
MTPPPYAIAAALEAARRSPCAKSQRGVCIYRPGQRGRGAPAGVVATGFNGEPDHSCAAADV